MNPRFSIFRGRFIEMQPGNGEYYMLPPVTACMSTYLLVKKIIFILFLLTSNNITPYL